MKTRLAAMTKPMVLVDGKELSAQDFIAYTARVSAPQNQSKIETGPKLIRYLIDNAHWSPLEQVSFTQEIETTRGLAPQIIRHGTFKFQEFSQRYSLAPGFSMMDARSQDSKNRQNSIDNLDADTKDWFHEAQQSLADTSFYLYQQALDKGIAKECARFLLPLNTTTTLFMTGSVRSWVHYLDLRRGNGTQKEHQDIANEIIGHTMIPYFPDVSAAMGWLK